MIAALEKAVRFVEASRVIAVASKIITNPAELNPREPV
jgi:hypothetical protein